MDAGRGATIFSPISCGVEASKLGIGIQLMRAFYSLPSLKLCQIAQKLFSSQLWVLRQKRKMCTVQCVRTCRAHKADGFYDFAVEDKWQRVKEAMRRMSIRELAILINQQMSF